MTLSQLTTDYKLVLGKRGEWHMLNEPRIGEINGLGRVFRGKLVAISDQGLGVIITGEDKAVIGHKDWFVEDVSSVEARVFNKQLVSTEDKYNNEFDLNGFEPK